MLVEIDRLKYVGSCLKQNGISLSGLWVSEDFDDLLHRKYHLIEKQGDPGPDAK